MLNFLCFWFFWGSIKRSSNFSRDFLFIIYQLDRIELLMFFIIYCSNNFLFFILNLFLFQKILFHLSYKISFYRNRKRSHIIVRFY